MDPLRHSPRPALIAVSVMLTWAVLAPGSLAAARGRTDARVTGRAAARKPPAVPPAPAQPEDPWLQALPPLDSGPGIVVCEPVAAGADGCGGSGSEHALGQPHVTRVTLARGQPRVSFLYRIL